MIRPAWMCVAFASRGEHVAHCLWLFLQFPDAEADNQGRKYDWRIVTTGRVSEEQHSTRDLVDFVQSVEATYRRGHCTVDSPYPQLVFRGRHKLASQISKLSVLSIWRLAFERTCYIVDITVRRSWTNFQDMSRGIAPRVSLTISIHGEHWDELALDSRDGGEHAGWGYDLEHLFYDEPGEPISSAEHRVRCFLLTLDAIRASLEAA